MIMIQIVPDISGLHPDDIRESARADMINDNLEDIRKKYTDVIYYVSFLWSLTLSETTNF